MKRYSPGMVCLLVAAAFGGGFVAQWTLGCRTVGAQDAAGGGIVRAREFIVVDGTGKEQVILGSDSGCTGLVVKDTQAAPRLLLGLLPEEQVGLVINNAAQKTQVALGAWKRTNRLRLYDGIGNQRIAAEVDREAGSSDFYLSDEDRVPRVSLELGPRGGGDFVLSSYAGTDVWRASQQMSGPGYR